MTKEEAIKILKGAIKKPNTKDGYLGQALDMAIKALEQQLIPDTRQRERQLEMEYQNGYDRGWEAGRKALEQRPCEDTVSCNCTTEEIAKSFIEDVESVKDQLNGQPCEDCISRQDAIGIVARIKEMHIDDREQYSINYGTICDIDLALQQLPSVTLSYNSIKTELEPSADCISRAKALEMLGDAPENWTDTEKEIQEVNDYRWFKSILEELPPVTPKTDVLDKIKAEIDQKQYDFMDDKDYDEGIRFGLMLAYQIINKYKAESEDRE